MRRHFIIIVLGIFQFGCIPLAEHHNKISPATKHEEYHEVSFSNLYEKNRSFPALETGIYAILDGILISSSQDTHLGKNNRNFWKNMCVKIDYSVKKVLIRSGSIN